MIMNRHITKEYIATYLDAIRGFLRVLVLGKPDVLKGLDMPLAQRLLAASNAIHETR